MSSPLQVLDKHVGYIKGLSWDPIGKYLISQGEDYQLIMWEMFIPKKDEQLKFGGRLIPDVRVHKIISDPWKNAKYINQTRYNRLSWDPRGTNFTIVNTKLKNKNYPSTLIDRDTTEPYAVLTGHENYITCAA